jgi:hypothetical protein
MVLRLAVVAIALPLVALAAAALAVVGVAAVVQFAAVATSDDAALPAQRRPMQASLVVWAVLAV